MRGARRHWPAAVTDTERDMSKELNTGRKERNTDTINMRPQTQAHQESPHTPTLLMQTHREAALREAHPSFIVQESIKLCSLKFTKERTEVDTQLTPAHEGRQKVEAGRIQSQDCLTPSMRPFHVHASLLTPGPESLWAPQKCGFLHS